MTFLRLSTGNESVSFSLHSLLQGAEVTLMNSLYWIVGNSQIKMKYLLPSMGSVNNITYYYSLTYSRFDNVLAVG